MGLANVAGEFSLSFLAYNIKRAISILGCAGLAAAVGRNALAAGLNFVGTQRVISTAILKV